jgi:hypothetical protein
LIGSSEFILSTLKETYTMTRNVRSTIGLALIALLTTFLLACSDGDSTTININPPSNNGGDGSSEGNSGGGDSSGETPASCPEGTSEVSEGLCELPATISADMTLSSGVRYLMSDRVTVGNGNGQLETNADGSLADGSDVQSVTLTIEAGVEVLGKSGTFANLLITRGSKILAAGTADAPIIFSSDDEGYDGSGEWGGLIIHGYAPHNECAEGGTYCDIDSEGESGFAGGYDPEDSSGLLRYVVVAEGGYEFSTGNEINGISLVGVGRGTEMDYIQVHGNSDDGIEFYGGTVNLKHGVFTNNNDDSVDWDEGYQGNLQYVIVKQGSSKGEAFEMDTEGSSEGFLSKPTLANVTVVAEKIADRADYSLNFKKRSAGFFHNTLVTVSPDSETALTTCVNVDGAGSQALVGEALVLNNWIQDCASGAGDRGTLANVPGLDNGTIYAVAAQLDGNFASQASAAVLSESVDWSAINSAYPESVADADYLEATDFIGAVNPDGSDVWWANWTIEGSVGNPTLPQASCPVGTDELDVGLCLLPPTVSSDLTLTAGVDYLMEGRVTVGNGNGQLETNGDGTLADGSSVRNITLTIEPGVQVMGKTGTFANLVITRGSKLMAMGTKSAPIVFSSDDAGLDGSGEWGGLIMHGYAPHNECDEGGSYCDIDSEGESGFAGGYDPDDNSGVLRYVVVAEGGYEFSTGNEINGISLVAVGRGTEMDYIQVHGNSDDGIEFYGGNVNVKHGVFTSNNDDSVDWDEGYQGNMQYIIVKQSASKGEAFEMDTEGSSSGFLSKPTLANVTIINDKVADRATYSLNFKKRSGGFFHNTVVTVAASSETAVDMCINVDGSGSVALAGTALVINNWIQDCAQGEGLHGQLSSSNVSFDTTTVIETNAALDAFLSSQAPEASGLVPLDWSVINGAYPESNADTSYLDATDYIGAVNPNGSDPWWAGWVVPGSL